MTTEIRETRKAREERERAEALGGLRELLKPGDTIHTILRHVSRSGMYRVIGLVITHAGGSRRIDYLAAGLLKGYDSRHDGCKAFGCGMDMGFHLVYNLSRQLFPDGFGEVGHTEAGHVRPDGIRPKTRKAAAKLQGEGVTFRGRNGDPSGWDNDGGYALDQRWL